MIEIDAVLVPRIKLQLRAGVDNFETVPDMQGDGHVQVPRDLLIALRLDPKNLLATGVRDRGMEPMIFEDDLVVFDTSDRKPISREIYAVNWNGEACIVQLVNRGGQWYLMSINPEFKPVNMKSGQCSIVGRVVIQPTRVLTGRL